MSLSSLFKKNRQKFAVLVAICAETLPDFGKTLCVKSEDQFCRNFKVASTFNNTDYPKNVARCRKSEGNRENILTKLDLSSI